METESLQSLTLPMLIQKYMTEKKRHNPLYSMRALAKNIGISPAQLSGIVSGHRVLSPGMALKICDFLGLSKIERRNILSELADAGEMGELQLRQLSEQEFRIIADWYHFAILSLTKVKGFKNDPKWIARRLGMDPFTVKLALKRLLALGFLEQQGSRLVQKDRGLHTSEEASSSAKKTHHKQQLKIAEDKLDSVPRNLREYSSMTLTVQLKKLTKAKELIHQFKNDLTKYLEGDGLGDEVYNLTINLYPLSEKKEDH